MLPPNLNLEKVSTAIECISAYDEQMVITLWNPALERRVGIAEKDAIGKSLFELFPFTKDDQRTKFMTIAMTMDQSFFFPNMIYLYTPPFTYYTQYIQPLKNNGKVTGVINIVRDHNSEESFSQDEFMIFFDRAMHAGPSLQYDKDRAHF